MSLTRSAPRLVRLGVAHAATLAFYLCYVRPRLLRWGTSDDELLREAPGDGAVADPYTVSTRAVTVCARPDQIWPWLVQMGTGRGGLYSYDWLDRLFGYSTPSSDTILPQFQNLTVGDVIPLGNGPSWPVIVADRNEALVVEPVAGQVSWAWLLDAVDTETTRLISRVRLRLGPRLLLVALAPALDLPWFVMERGMLLGIKRRAEDLARSATAAHPSNFGSTDRLSTGPKPPVRHRNSRPARGAADRGVDGAAFSSKPQPKRGTSPNVTDGGGGRPG